MHTSAAAVYDKCVYSDACAITDPDTTTSEGVTVVVTGGYSDLLPRYRDNVTRCGQGRVSIYTTQCWQVRQVRLGGGHALPQPGEIQPRLCQLR